MKSLFIGLGGAGTYAVAELKKKMMDYGYNVNQDRFLFIDTDRKILNDYDFVRNDWLSFSGDDNNDYSVESVRIVATENRNSFDSAVKKQAEQFFSWFDEESPSLRSNKNLKAGAEGARMFTRVMEWKNYDDLKTRINRYTRYTDSNGNERFVERVYLVSGTCGGTGSGSVLDVMHLLGEIHNENQRAAVDMKVVTILIMPQGYIKPLKTGDIRIPKYRLNAYAMMDEINACVKNYYDTNIRTDRKGLQFYRYRCSNSTGTIRPFGFTVCDTLFMLDSYDNKNKRDALEHSQVSDNVANFLFAMESGTAARDITTGNFCNIKDSVAMATSSMEYIKGFSTNGMYIVQTWEELIRKYVKEKFIYQMFKYGFVGSDAFRLDQSRSSYNDADQEFSRILGDCKSEFDRSSKECRSRLFSTKDKTIIKQTATCIENSLESKDNNVEEIFKSNPQQSDRETLKELVDDYLNEVKNKTYALCMEWVKKYSLRHVKQLIDKLDEKYDKEYGLKAGLIKAECEKATESLKFKGDRKSECKKAFDYYLEYLVYRNLTNGDDGFLDDCRRCIVRAIDNINEEGRKLPNSELIINEWELRFARYLTSLKADTTRKLIPALPDNILSQANNELDAKYNGIINQIEDGSRPVLDSKAPTGRSYLYDFKKLVIEELLRNNRTWENEKFTIQNFSDSVGIILDEYMKKVLSLAESQRVSRHSSLSIQFMEIYSNILEDEEKEDVKKALSTYADLALSLTQPAANSPTTTGQIVYLSKNLDENTGLGKELKEMTDAGNKMGVSVSNSSVADRLIKLYVKSGYSFNDYEYFDIYREEFDRYYANPTDDLHQCYIHKEFLKARKRRMSLTQLFEKDAEDDYKKALKDLWNEKEGMVFKFAILFMTRMLIELKETDLIKHFSPLNSFIEEKKDDVAKTWQISLGLTNDLANNPTRLTYRQIASTCFNMLNAFTRSDIESYKNYIEFWSVVLDMLSEDTSAFVTNTKLKDILKTAYDDLDDKLGVAEQDDLKRLKDKYSEFEKDEQGNYKLDAFRHQILTDWKWKEFLNDCLIGLFDR
jgi:hypothetical protein